jgi:hypothetical protein
VVHPSLFLKLTDLGVNGLFYKKLKNMYDNSVLRIKIENTLSPEFISIGVRQADTLIPQLFKSFINDMHAICDDTCDPATLSRGTGLLHEPNLLLFNNIIGLKEFF